MKWTIQKMPRFHELEANLEPDFASFAAGESLAITVKDHVSAASSSRHRTASRLGATPTGHLSEGAANIRMEEEGGRAVVTVPIPGITRAFGDLHITPKNKKWLTIPINAVAYGVRAPEMQDDGWHLFSVPSKKNPGTRILFGRESGTKSAIALYLLRDEVDVPQDRGLMPSDEEMEEALAIGISDEIARTRT